MKKLVVYSHDTFGLGNIKRMLAVTQHLLDSMPDLSVLLISGSPMIHHFHLPEKRFDYLKLPCLGRTQTGEYKVKKLGAGFEALVAIRSQIIQATVANFNPDIILVDKKPRGVADELLPTLELIRRNGTQTKVTLLLRDILDDPETTRNIWFKNDYFKSIERYYHSIFVMGSAEVFNVGREYRFPENAAKKIEYCGYTQRARSAAAVELNNFFANSSARRVLVTAGGGEDGYQLIKTYLAGVSASAESQFCSLIVTGPEMSSEQRNKIHHASNQLAQVQALEFTPNLLEYMRHADVVVSMAGYNTVVEILSLNKQAVVVPRTKPVQEQLIRAKRLERMGLLTCVTPSQLTSDRLMHAVYQRLSTKGKPLDSNRSFDFNGLPNLAGHIQRLFDDSKRFKSVSGFADTNRAIPSYLPEMDACWVS